MGHGASLLAALALALVAHVSTAQLVPAVAPHLLAKGLGGKDLLKPKSDKQIPEATGVVGAALYVLLMTLFAPLPYLAHLIPASPTAAALSPTPLEAYVGAFPHHAFAAYLACLLSLSTATFLGFLDDVFDIRWRFKVPIPLIASIPLLITYAAAGGVTDVVIPRVFGLRRLLKVEETNGLLALGPLYYVYMSMLSTFCTNSINILAGLNGVEVGQALVIALSVAFNDLLHLSVPVHFGESKLFTIGFGLARGSPELVDRHLFSLYFMLPLIGVCFGLLKHNWYPAQVFIGDTFCYFAGMAFAVVGIIGHFSKTLLLFFVPQTFNFIYSCPQLFGLVPCPRHRLPKFNEALNACEPSWAVFSKPIPRLGRLVLEVFAALRLVRVQRDPARQGQIVACTNLTLLNLLLVTFGPMPEKQLTECMLAVQVAASALAFAIRYGAASYFYDATRR